MPRGYRSIILAVVAGLILANTHQPQHKRHHNQAAEQTEPADPPAPPYKAYPAPDSGACYNAPNHDTADLCAQWRAAVSGEKAAHEARRATNWAIIATFLSAATVFGLIVTIWQTSGALGEARRGNRIAMKANARATRQSVASGKETAKALEEARRNADATASLAKLTREIGEAQIRCYLTGVKARIGFSERGNIVARCTIKNSGRSPAKRVIAYADLRFFQSIPTVNIDFPTEDKDLIRYKDIGVGGSEQLVLEDFRPQFSHAELSEMLGSDSFLITLDVTVEGEDIFGSHVVHRERFQAHTVLPKIDKWVDLEPCGHFRSKKEGQSETENHDTSEALGASRSEANAS